MCVRGITRIFKVFVEYRRSTATTTTTIKNLPNIHYNSIKIKVKVNSYKIHYDKFIRIQRKTTTTTKKREKNNKKK